MGKYYRLRFIPNMGQYDGKVDSPDTPNKEIWIRQGLSLKDEVCTLLHEIGHIFDWSKDEEIIDQQSKELTNLLFKLGYIKDENKKMNT